MLRATRYTRRDECCSRGMLRVCYDSEMDEDCSGEPGATCVALSMEMESSDLAKLSISYAKDTE
jgi:hypothetical protein